MLQWIWKKRVAAIVGTPGTWRGTLRHSSGPNWPVSPIIWTPPNSCISYSSGSSLTYAVLYAIDWHWIFNCCTLLHIGNKPHTMYFCYIRHEYTAGLAYTAIPNLHLQHLYMHTHRGISFLSYENLVSPKRSLFRSCEKQADFDIDEILL